MTVPTMPIDTQQVVDRLSRAGVPEEQAKAHASVLAYALQTYDAQLGARVCTKRDLAAALEPINTAIVKLDASVAALNAKIDATAAALDAKIDVTAAALDAKIDATAAALDAKIDATAARLEARIDAAVSKVKSDLVIWVVSAGIFQTSLITALVLNVAG